MEQHVKYEISIYGNEYYAGYSFANSYKEALLKYNKEVELVKHLTNVPKGVRLHVPHKVYIKIISLKTDKTIKSVCIDVD